VPDSGAPAAVAVLDEEQAEAPVDDGRHVGDAEAPEPPPSERRHTTPEPGTAAERAARRRARMREQGDGKEQS
jgi:hypothetical protein